MNNRDSCRFSLSTLVGCVTIGFLSVPMLAMLLGIFLNSMGGIVALSFTICMLLPSFVVAVIFWTVAVESCSQTDSPSRRPGGRRTPSIWD